MFRWFRERRAKSLMMQAIQAAADGNYDRAVYLASGAIILRPHDAEVYQQRGMWYHLADNHQLALQDYGRAIELAPDVATLYIERGALHADAGDHQQAIADFTAALRLEPENEHAYQARGKSYTALDEVEKAIADFSAAIHVAPDISANYRFRAELRAITGNIKGALEDYDQALPPVQKGLKDSQTLLDHLQQQTTPDGRQLATAQHLNAVFRHEVVELLVQRAMARQLLGDLPGALHDLDEALSIDPDNAAAHNGRGRVRYQQGDMDAIADFHRALKLDPHRYGSYLNLAEAYFKLKQIDKALAAFQQLDERQPNHAMAQMGLSLCEHALGKRSAAKKRWRLLVANDEQFADLDWLKTNVFTNHPLLLREASNLVVRL